MKVFKRSGKTNFSEWARGRLMEEFWDDQTKIGRIFIKIGEEMNK